MTRGAGALAHSGFNRPEPVREVLRRPSRLWCDLAFRGDHATQGRVDPDWREAFTEFPNRFMVGTDTFTPERWHYIGEHARYSRGWLADLPRRWPNASAGATPRRWCAGWPRHEGRRSATAGRGPGAGADPAAEPATEPVVDLPADLAAGFGAAAAGLGGRDRHRAPCQRSVRQLRRPVGRSGAAGGRARRADRGVGAAPAPAPAAGAGAGGPALCAGHRRLRSARHCPAGQPAGRCRHARAPTGHELQSPPCRLWATTASSTRG